MIWKMYLLSNMAILSSIHVVFRECRTFFFIVAVQQTQPFHLWKKSWVGLEHRETWITVSQKHVMSLLFVDRKVQCFKYQNCQSVGWPTSWHIFAFAIFQLVKKSSTLRRSTHTHTHTHTHRFLECACAANAMMQPLLSKTSVENSGFAY